MVNTAALRSMWPNMRPPDQRGYFTAFIQTTATLGLLLSLIVIISVQGYINGAYPDMPVLDAAGNAVMLADGSPSMMKAFNAWGWRIPFLGSIFLLLISLYIRLQMNESPAFKKMKEEGAASKAPLREAFGTWKNGKIAIIALLGLTAGQAVVWYSGQFYALFFMQNVIKVDSFSANVFVAWSLILGTCGLHLLWPPVRPYRPQADHPGRLPDCRCHLFPGVHAADQDRQPDAARGPANPGHRDRRPQRLFVPVQPDRYGQVHFVLRHRQGQAVFLLGQLGDGGWCCGRTHQGQGRRNRSGVL